MTKTQDNLQTGQYMTTLDPGQPHPGTKANPLNNLKPGTLLNLGQSQIQETFEQNSAKWRKIY